MDIKQEYREETNEDIYCEGWQNVGNGSYKDKYVKWLEQKLIKKLIIFDVMSITLPDPQQWFMEKYDVDIERMNLVEHKGNDVVKFIYAYCCKH